MPSWHGGHVFRARNNNESRGGVPLVVALELSPLREEAGPGPAEGSRATDRRM